MSYWQHLKKNLCDPLNYLAIAIGTFLAGTLGFLTHDPLSITDCILAYVSIFFVWAAISYFKEKKSLPPKSSRKIAPRRGEIRVKKNHAYQDSEDYEED